MHAMHRKPISLTKRIVFALTPALFLVALIGFAYCVARLDATQFFASATPMQPAAPPTTAPEISVEAVSSVTNSNARLFTTAGLRVVNRSNESVWYWGSSATTPYWGAQDRIANAWTDRGGIHCGTGAQAFELKPGQTFVFEAFLAQGSDAMMVELDFAASPESGSETITARSAEVLAEVLAPESL